jgi:hypothetical protein
MLSSKQVAKWKPQDWLSKVKYMRPSKNGAVGVLFCWTTEAMNPLFDHENQGYGNPATCDFIVKPIVGGAAPTKFAEHVMGMIADTGSPDSQPIERNSPEGKVIVQLAQKMKANSGSDYNGQPPSLHNVKAQTRVNENRDRWAQIISSYNNAQYFLIQNNIEDQKELGDEYRKGSGLSNFLSNEALIANLGKLFVADAILGNGDRLSQPNTGNIMYSSKNKFWSIDSSTVLTTYKDVLNDFTTLSWGDFNPNPQNGTEPPTSFWANGIVNYATTSTPSPAEASLYKQGFQPRAIPGFSLSTLFEPDQWWNNVFRPHFTNHLVALAQENKKKGLHPSANPTPPTPPQWQQALIWFKKGVDEGLAEVDRKLSGLSWFSLKSKYKSFVSKFGGDSNVDWTNFKIRRLYIRARLKGQNADAALTMVQEYVKRKSPILY